jgi:hypothetical protein
LLLLLDLLAQHGEFGRFRHAPQLATLARLGDARNDSRARDASALDGLDLQGGAHSSGAAGCHRPPRPLVDLAMHGPFASAEVARARRGFL